MLASAVDVTTLRSQWLHMLVYGNNGVGKTRLASTFPKPLLLVSFEPQDEGGALTVAATPGVKFIRPGSTERARQLADELAGGDAVCDLPDPKYRGKRYQSLVFDSVTSYQQLKLQELMGWDQPAVQLNFGDVPGDVYRERAEVVKQHLRSWVGLPYHVVFTGKEKDHNPPKEERVNEKTGKVQPDMRPKFIRGLQQTSLVSVDLGGSAAGWLLDAVPFFGRLYMELELVPKKTKVLGEERTEMRETGRYVRALLCSYRPPFVARFQSCRDVPDVILNPTYERISAAIDGKEIS